METARVKRIHHLNLIVRRLEDSVPFYERLLGRKVDRRDALPGRGVITARFRLGETWLVLVEPVDPDGEPGRFLAAHGEGFFLLSFEVDDVGEARRSLGESLFAGPTRSGLDGWRVADVRPELSFGAQLQLSEEGRN